MIPCEPGIRHSVRDWWCGCVNDRGDMPTVDVNGSYSWKAFGFTLIDESDMVSIAYDVDQNVFVGVFGGGQVRACV